MTWSAEVAGAVAMVATALISALVAFAKRKPDAAKAIVGIALDTATAADKQRDDALADRTRSEQRIGVLEARLDAVETQLTDVRSQRDLYASELRKAREQVEELRRDVTDLRGKLVQAQANYEQKLQVERVKVTQLTERVELLEQKLRENDIPIPPVEP